MLVTPPVECNENTNPAGSGFKPEGRLVIQEEWRSEQRPTI